LRGFRSLRLQEQEAPAPSSGTGARRFQEAQEAPAPGGGGSRRLQETPRGSRFWSRGLALWDVTFVAALKTSGKSQKEGRSAGPGDRKTACLSRLASTGLHLFHLLLILNWLFPRSFGNVAPFMRSLGQTLPGQQKVYGICPTE
jgi:hypothetical protein